MRRPSRSQPYAAVGRGAGAAAGLPQINGLRGIAIIAVLSYHIIAGVFARDGLPPGLSVLVANGWSGVNLFFILSGFVLFLPYAADEGVVATLAKPFAFYRRRCRRLLPLFFIGAIGTWSLAAIGGAPIDPRELLRVLSFAFLLDAGSFGPSFNSPLWSIGDEIAFSALFPLLALGFRQHGAGRIVVTALAAALAMRIAGIWRFPAVQGPTFNSDMFACRIDEFVIGMALAQAYVVGRLPRCPGLWAIVGMVLVILAWTGFDGVLREEFPPLVRAVLSDVLDVGLVAIVAAALAPGRLAAALSWRPLQVVGMMCYSVYIWHLPLLRLVAGDRAVLSAPVFAAAIAGFLVLTFAVAALSYRFIEFPGVGDWRRLFLLRYPARII